MEIKAIICDADDTLWSNEPLFRNAEQHCFEILKEYGTPEWLNAELYRTETDNMEELGYGAKAFILSMIETAVRVSGGKISAEKILQLEQTGRAILRNQATPLDGVEETLTSLRQTGRYELAILTKGELLDQNNKIDRSGLRKHFDYVDVVNEKTPEVYSELCARLEIRPEEMVMVGNSFKSDIDPVLKIGGKGVYIPSPMTWQHEIVEEYEHPGLYRADTFRELPGILEMIQNKRNEN